MGYIVIFIIGLAIGGTLVRLWSRSTSVGELRVDHSDPEEEPYLFLVLKKDVEKISKMRQVTLQVHIKDFVPHK